MNESKLLHATMNGNFLSIDIWSIDVIRTKGFVKQYIVGISLQNFYESKRTSHNIDCIKDSIDEFLY